MSKTLFLLTLPIGNLGDVSQRLISALNEGKHFFVEDTRNFIKILNLLEIPSSGKVIEAFHEHTQDQVEQIVEKYIENTDIYVASDAGSPVLSDPGFPLVRGWIEAGGEVLSISGVSAVTSSLEVSGLAPLPFKFHGFLPRKREAIENSFLSCSAGVTHIFFESPHRIAKTLDYLAAVYPDSNVFVGRELTKKFEEHLRFKAKDWLSGTINLKDKGEFVLLFHHKEDSGAVNSNLEQLADSYLEKPSKKSLARLIAGIKGGKASDYYNQV